MSDDYEENEMTALDYINMLAPHHFRMSCEEGESHNSAFVYEGVIHDKCTRCTLFAIMQLGEKND